MFLSQGDRLSRWAALSITSTLYFNFNLILLIMKTYKKVPINDNLYDGDCRLWYDVVAIVGIGIMSRTVHHVCPYDRCHSFEQAIDFYYEHFHRDTNTIIKCCHHKYDKETLNILALAC